MIALLALPFFLSGCKLEETLLPTDATGNDLVSSDGSVVFGTGSGFTAPIISDPLSGSAISEAQPTLTVLNSAQDESASRTYLFQVSADTAFTAFEAQSTQVPEGPNGTTSWELDRPLSEGRHFWRVRSRAGTTDSQFSATAEFSISGGGGSTPPPNNPPPEPNPSPPPPAAGTIVSDPLIGGSIGQANGGQFTSSGWLVTAPGNFIRYEVPPMVSGWVEFDTSGLRESNSSPNQFMLFGMWDPSAGSYRTNPFRVHLQKLHPNPHNPPYLRLRWIANGEQHDEGNNFLDWNQERTYHWRVEWGPSGGSHTAQVFLDGQLMITVNYNRAYSSNMLFIELGLGERGESVVGTNYSNLQIGN